MAAGSIAYSGANLLQISMPMGGIGAGNTCLSGYGAVQDFAIKGTPATSATPDDWNLAGCAFGLLHIKSGVTRLLEGPLPAEKVYDQGNMSQGYRKGGYEGLPRFEGCKFTSYYPYGTVSLSDPEVPLSVEIQGWSPFIPLDDVNSGIPCSILNYVFTNRSSEPVDFEFSFHVSHFAEGTGGAKGSRNKAIPGRGLILYNTDDPASATYGSVGLTVLDDDPKIKAMWFRGHWFDALSALWREVSTGSFTENDGSLSEKGMDGRNGGSVMVSKSLLPGASLMVPVVLSWHFPNNAYSVGCEDGDKEKVWHPFYTTQWTDAAEVGAYVADHFEGLDERTQAFADTLHSTTLPLYVIDAISSNLAILKSPTVLRQSTGNLWCWEGCFTDKGCCHGSCTHVWNYAQAFPHLFPNLERTLREQEYLRSMDERGHVNFRAALPDGPTTHTFHAAADGQLGGIQKTFRDWQISGDTEWLAEMYPLVKKSLDYCIETWDPSGIGALVEPHHNTYDIEFWGPDGMCTSIYVGALAAMASMAKGHGQSEDHAHYSELAIRAAAYMDAKLYNGEYYEQQVEWDGLRDKSFSEYIAGLPPDDQLDEMDALAKAEGPKYQYKDGCISDGVIGAWMSKIYGIDTKLSKDHVRNHLAAIFRHNFKPDLSKHVCVQRPGYAIGHESGLLLCSWPREKMPTLPFVYSDEVWTGIDYQVASHMIEEGLIEEGLSIVGATRRRYNGHTRNPFNEYECGNYYARALASYALLGALTGFRYSAVSKTLWFGPRVEVDGPFKTFFCAASGFGAITLSADELTIEMREGELEVESLVLTVGDSTTRYACRVMATWEFPATIPIA